MRVFSVLSLVASFILAPPAHAQGESYGAIDSVVVGAFAHEVASDEEGGLDANLELRMRPLFGHDWAVKVLPTVGGTVNLKGDTDTAYLGATARYRLNRSFFVEGFFGLALHDADTPSDADGLDLGCELLFREGAGVGYQRGKHAMSLYISHASHGDILCDEDENDGMTSVGLRYGYHF